MTLDASAAYPLFATAYCSIVAVPKTRASHLLLCLLVCYRPLASILLLHLSVCCNHQDISKAIDVCNIVYSVAPPHRCIFSRQFGAHSQCAACPQLHTR